MIRSIRKILRSVVTNQLVNYKTRATILAEVEKILYDRPLTQLTDDSNDLEPLTPNKLLLQPNSSRQPVDFG